MTQVSPKKKDLLIWNTKVMAESINESIAKNGKPNGLRIVKLAQSASQKPVWFEIDLHLLLTI